MNEKIGKVTLNLDYYEGQDFYSDGVIEEHLLELVKHHEPEDLPMTRPISASATLRW